MTGSEHDKAAEETNEITTTKYRVAGMTCEHCVGAVSTEIEKLSGVTGVDVDLADGVVTVSSYGRIVFADVATAVDEAGYDFVGPDTADDPST